jgi:hypothetical protein
LSSGLSTKAVIGAKGDLLRHGVIVKAGTYPSGYPNPGTLYEPADRDEYLF